MPYIVVEAFGHDSHTDQKAYVTNDPPQPEHSADFKRWVVFIEDEFAAYEHAMQRSILCRDDKPLAEQVGLWANWLEAVDFGE